MKFTPSKPYLLGETLETLTERLKTGGHPAFRAKQIMEWLYKKFVTNPDEMTNLSTELKSWLKETFSILPTQRILIKGDPDTTQKLLLKLEDGSLIETVLIKAPDFNDPEDKFRKTVCISTQVGCAMGCKFCASGLAGWKRDLYAGEIVSQLFEIIKLCKEEGSVSGNTDEDSITQYFDNIVVMGMGEPLHNFDNTFRALSNLNAAWGFKFGARRVTVSTSGLVPRIRELADLPVQFRLAISLHGATNDVRTQIMPVNKRYPLEELIPAARYYNEKHNRMLTFEYILIDELNDTYEQAEALIKICKGESEGVKPMKVHINCIPYNKVEGLKWKRPSILRQQAFVKKLKDAGLSVTIRHEKGHKIEAACGQLRLQEEKKRAQEIT
jgi:23S rRNA (adenine2503-C2)-methyltransferase